mmetsp:Transcript_16372/g.43267  ORF Transcript_16372/g.43267 Transcript_16372/m.43267 type:complete len:265 (-) Transcript_16372:181-975(-)
MAFVAVMAVTAFIAFIACDVALEVTQSTLRILAEEVALHVAQEEADPQPALDGHLRHRRDAVRHIHKLQAQGRGEVPGELEILRHHVAEGHKHANAAVPQLRRAAALEGIHVPIRGELKQVPEAHRRLHAKLGLEGARRDPHLRASGAQEAVLRNHARNGHHGQTTVVELSLEAALVVHRVGGPASLARHEETGHGQLATEDEVARQAVGVLPQREELQEGNEAPDLSPAPRRHPGERRNTVRVLREPDASRWGEVAWPAEVLR